MRQFNKREKYLKETSSLTILKVHRLPSEKRENLYLAKFFLESRTACCKVQKYKHKMYKNRPSTVGPSGQIKSTLKSK